MRKIPGPLHSSCNRKRCGPGNEAMTRVHNALWDTFSSTYVQNRNYDHTELSSHSYKYQWNENTQHSKFAWQSLPAWSGYQYETSLYSAVHVWKLKHHVQISSKDGKEWVVHCSTNRYVEVERGVVMVLVSQCTWYWSPQYHSDSVTPILPFHILHHSSCFPSKLAAIYCLQYTWEVLSSPQQVITTPVICRLQLLGTPPLKHNFQRVIKSKRRLCAPVAMVILIRPCIDTNTSWISFSWKVR